MIIFSIILSIDTSFSHATSLTEAFSPALQRNVQQDGRLQPILIPSLQLNLIPLSEAWDFSANNNRPKTVKFKTFASLVPKLGCKSQIVGFQ
jgi:hypothetical protein